MFQPTMCLISIVQKVKQVKKKSRCYNFSLKNIENKINTFLFFEIQSTDKYG